MTEHVKEFHVDVWPEVYASRQTRSVLRWPVVAVEEHEVRLKGEDGEPRTEKVLCLAVMKHGVKGIIPLHESGVNPAENRRLTRARLMRFLGQEVDFIVTAIDAQGGVFMASRKAALERLAAATWAELAPGARAEAVARRQLEEMSRRLLANPVLEDFACQVEPADRGGSGV